MSNVPEGTLINYQREKVLKGSEELTDVSLFVEFKLFILEKQIEYRFKLLPAIDEWK